MKKPYKKYGNVKCTKDGITFDSKREMRVYDRLKALESANKITDLELQPVFPIVIDAEQVRFSPSNRPLKYISDFRFYDCELDKWRVWDAKGFKTDAYKIKKALVQHIYDIEVEEI